MVFGLVVKPPLSACCFKGDVFFEFGLEDEKSKSRFQAQLK